MAEAIETPLTPASETQQTLPLEQVKVDKNLTLRAIPVEHNKREFKKYGQELIQEIQNSDGVIFEYFPPELEPLIKNSFYARNLTNYPSFAPFFGPLAEAALQAGKAVYVLDPAHDANYGYVRAVETAITPATAATSYVLGFPKLPSKEKWAISRRGVLKGLIGTLAGAVVYKRGILDGLATLYKEQIKHRTDTNFLSESNFRRVVVARGIRLLGADSKRPRNLVLLYPPAHWEGIKKLLASPQRVEREFRAYSALKNINEEVTNSLFSIRRYEPESGTWQLREQQEIV